ncbi:MAG: UDP-4-amino-4,6-dideoxy-N-acetyl-beta-L-altrosamine transaminase [Salaquimonas sp.]
MIPYGRHEITDEDILAVNRVLKSDFLVQGPEVESFEKQIADYCNAKFAIAANSATSALHLSYLALGVGPGDLVWTSPITFVATSNTALLCGADVDFVDIDPETFNMSADLLAEKLVAVKAAGGRLPKVVTPVHMAGLSCDMKAIHALSKEYGFRIVEDASHCIGASYMGKPVGNCDYSDICVFSFHPVKIITTGEGGLTTTNDAELAQRIGMLRSHGISRDEELMTHPSDGPWYYQQHLLGLNYRMTELQGALGKSQLARLDDIIAERHRLAERYDVFLADMPVKLPFRPDGIRSSFHLYIIRVDTEKCTNSHRRIFEMLREKGLGVQLHYIPVHTQPYYERLGFKKGDFPLSEAYYSCAISIPLFPTLGDERQDEVIAILKEVLV